MTKTLDEVSMRQVSDAGAQIVEIGHSGRRSQFSETTAALDQRLVPLVCLGSAGSSTAAA